MKQLLKHSLILVFALLLFMSAPALADVVQGQIAWVTPDDQTLTLVDENNNVMRFRLVLTGQLTIDGQEDDMWGVRPGAFATVTYENRDGDFQATRIAVDRRRQ